LIDLSWLRVDAPYMPVIAAGLLAVLADRDADVQAVWVVDGRGERLRMMTALDCGECARAILDAPLPRPENVPWSGPMRQGLAPTLEATPNPLAEYRRLVEASAETERRMLRAIATDGALATSGAPARSRLLRGVKADLSAFKPVRRTTAEALSEELRTGPVFVKGDTGESLGLVPELQTFGGTTGAQPSSIGAASPLLSRLLRHGVLALPPVGVTVRGARRVGGPLVTDGDHLSWPVWMFGCGLRELRALFSLRAVHRPEPDGTALGMRGVSAVYRSGLRALSTTVSVFRWGRRVA